MFSSNCDYTIVIYLATMYCWKYQEFYVKNKSIVSKHSPASVRTGIRLTCEAVACTHTKRQRKAARHSHRSAISLSRLSVCMCLCWVAFDSVKRVCSALIFCARIQSVMSMIYGWDNFNANPNKCLETVVWHFMTTSMLISVTIGYGLQQSKAKRRRD